MADKLCEVVSKLTDQELGDELKAAGFPPAPITPTTRKLFERKLARLRGQYVLTNEEISQESGENELQKERIDHEKGPSEKESCVNKSNSLRADVMDESPKLFYGVWYPPDNTGQKKWHNPSVFTNREEALQAVKRVKGSRFNVYKTFSEAEKFGDSTHGNNEQLAPVSNVMSNSPDPSSNFKAPKVHELANFRKTVEQGNVKEFVNLINSNPR